MGSFSWLKADTLTQTANIAYGEPFKFLIPAEFDVNGIGYIKDHYRDYGYLGDVNEEDKIKEWQYGKYDMYELLAIFNSDYQIPNDMTINVYGTHSAVTFAKGTRVGDMLKGVDMSNPLKPIDKDTEFNRSVGIDIGCYDKDIDKLPYPLKLVSASYNKTYEECAGRSYGDPEQGSKLSRDSLYSGAYWKNDCRYDGVKWKDLHKQWEQAEKGKSSRDIERD